jgi:hypothetical protein
MSILATLIKIIHFLVVVFIVVTPFCGTPYMLSLHLLVVPLILGHWATNQTICALTEIEKLLSGKTCDEETFFGRLVGPVYKFKTQKEENLFVWTLMITLWLVTFTKLQANDFAYLRGEKERLLALWRSI